MQTPDNRTTKSTLETIEEFRVTDFLKNALKLGKAECKQRILEIKKEIQKL